MAATVSELDRFEDLSVSSGTKKGRLSGRRHPSRRVVVETRGLPRPRCPSRRVVADGRRQESRRKEAVVMPGRHGRQKAGSQGRRAKSKEQGKGKKVLFLRPRT
ncbi:hypothetical protein ZWY2020_030161 [Hordeum vulgare]|nr:hypothetical protein ZWY2020_030161 [Hordeum vulgare]